MLFESGATVTVGGVPATNVDVAGPTSDHGDVPGPRRPDRSTTSSVTNPSGTSGTLANGWVADFSDVPSSQQFYFHVTQLVANAITAGVRRGSLLPAQSP